MAAFYVTHPLCTRSVPPWLFLLFRRFIAVHSLDLSLTDGIWHKLHSEYMSAAREGPRSRLAGRRFRGKFSRRRLPQQGATHHGHREGGGGSQTRFQPSAVTCPPRPRPVGGLLRLRLAADSQGPAADLTLRPHAHSLTPTWCYQAHRKSDDGLITCLSRTYSRVGLPRTLSIIH